MKPKILISACLTGVPCRYDGKANPLPRPVMEQLDRLAELIPVCPECGCGWGVPRPTIRCSAENGRTKLRRCQDGEDLTALMTEFAVRFLRENDFTLWIGQNRSPSCGLRDAPYGGGQSGDGFFSAAVRRAGFPCFSAAEIIAAETDLNSLLFSTPSREELSK